MIFSRLNYCKKLFIDLLQYQIKCLLKLQGACAGFVLNKYATFEDIAKSKWLLVPERINFTIAKLIFKGLLKEKVPENLEIQVRTSNRSLKTPNKVTLEYKNLLKQQSFYINYANTLQHNELPNEIENVNNIKQQLIMKKILFRQNNR